VACRRRQSGFVVNTGGPYRPRSPVLEQLRAEPRRFTFDAVVRIISFFQRRADPAEAARYTAVAGSSFLGAEVTEVRLDAFPQVIEGVNALKAIAKTATDGKPLDVHPVMKSEGLGGAYAQRLGQLITTFCGEQNLSRVAFMISGQDGKNWTFGALSFTVTSFGPVASTDSTAL